MKNLLCKFNECCNIGSDIGKQAQKFLENHQYCVVENDYLCTLNEEMTQKEVDDFISKLKKEDEVYFKFKKVDGTIRRAVGTLKPDVIKKGLRAQDIENARKRRKVPDSIIVYWDLTKKMFRSFRKDNFIGLI